MNPYIAATALALTAIGLLYAGTTIALSRPAPDGKRDRTAAPRPARPDQPGPLTMTVRALAIVGVMTAWLAVMAASASTHVAGLSVLGVLLILATVTGNVGFARHYTTTTAQRIIVHGAAAVTLAAWLMWPGWPTATILAGLITIQAITIGQLTWSFRSLAITGLVLAFGYDAIQVWATHRMLAMAAPAATDWLPIMYYAPATLRLGAPAGMILGVGDVAIPAILIIAAGRIAQSAGRPAILYAALSGYAAGLTLTFARLLTAPASTALPVTVFTIPAIIAAVYAAATRTGIRPMLATTGPPHPQVTDSPEPGSTG